MASKYLNNIYILFASKRLSLPQGGSFGSRYNHHDNLAQRILTPSYLLIIIDRAPQNDINCAKHSNILRFDF